MRIIAHRGASGYAPENTLAAFELALKMGAKAFEFDVHLTKDQQLVVHHDYDLKRMAGRPELLACFDYVQLREIKIGACEKFPSERVPLLAEVTELISPAAEWINFEVKNDGNKNPGIEKALLEFIRARPGLAERAVISTFDWPSLQRLRAADKDIKLAYLGHHLGTILMLPAILRAKSVGAVNFHLSLRIAAKLNLSLIRHAGFSVCVYTVNRKEDALRMKAFGVDGIFSNYPDILDK